VRVLLTHQLTNQNVRLALHSALAFLFTGLPMKKELRFQTNPRGLRADNAALYLGMSKTKFLELVGQGVIPRAIEIGGVKIWDRFERRLNQALPASKKPQYRRQPPRQLLPPKPLLKHS
jgi:predicted DNA-binding transcriptional regulator AlpA